MSQEMIQLPQSQSQHFATISTIQSPLGPNPHDEVVFSMNADDYEIGNAIGFGSSAIVYIATYKPIGRTVAIKMIELDRFERNQIDELRKEIQVMTLCKSIFLLTILATFVNDSKLWIVTPFLAAGSCLDIIRTYYTFGIEESVIASILYQALQGLDYLHKNGHIHRDVKAGNLLMDKDGLVQLADFGVSSSLMEDGGERKGVRKTFVGTPCWMAPEVMEMTRGYNTKADIWSFGITALELAYGSAPFAKYPPMKVIYLTLSNNPPTLDRSRTKHKYSKNFKEMIDSCLQRDPNKRPTAEALLKHPFFKAAKKKSHLVATILQNLPPVNERIGKNAAEIEKRETGWAGEDTTQSWDFREDDEPLPIDMETQDEPIQEPGDISHASPPLVPPMASSAYPRGLDRFSAHMPPPPQPPPPLPLAPLVSSSSSPPSSSTPGHGQAPALFPVPIFIQGSREASPPLSDTTFSPAVHHLSGLSASGSMCESEGSAAPEVRKGRFSVNVMDTITSPPSAGLTGTAGSSVVSPNESEHSLQNATSESGATTDGKKGRFEISGPAQANHSSSSEDTYVYTAEASQPSFTQTESSGSKKSSRFRVQSVGGEASSSTLPTSYSLSLAGPMSLSGGTTTNSFYDFQLRTSNANLIDGDEVMGLIEHTISLNEEQRASLRSVFLDKKICTRGGGRWSDASDTSSIDRTFRLLESQIHELLKERNALANAAVRVDASLERRDHPPSAFQPPYHPS